MAQTSVEKDIKYLAKDFVSFRNALINFSKIYFPDSYKDFNESSLGMMYMEMSAYIGDILSYYLDSNLKESMLIYAEERKNVLYLAQSLGYKVKSTYPAYTSIDLYQQIPAKVNTNGESDVDFRYALKIAENMQVSSETSNQVIFRTTEPVDFSNYQTQDFNATVYTVDAGNKPLVFLLKKTVPAIAGTISTIDFPFTDPESFAKVVIPFSDVIEILDVTDSDGNIWYEVDYLAQDTIMVDEINDTYHTTTDTDAERQESPYILKMKQVSRRFVTRKNIDMQTELQFGSGISSYPDQVLIPTPQTVNTFLSQFTFTDVANNFLNTRTYGLTPSNTTLTVRYTRGGGIESNVPQNDLTRISSITYTKTEDDFANNDDKAIYAQMRNTLSVSNSEPATGGRGEETIDEIRQNALAYFAAQDRCVTYEDYTVRALAMPSKYGNVSKAVVKKTNQNFSIDLYVLGKDYQGHLSQLSNTVKENLSTYLSNYRELTTAVNIKDAFIVNIGVQFSIICHPKYNKNEVLLKCIDEIKSYFEVDKWQINQPIVLSDIYNFLDDIEGVRTVSEVNIYNKYSTAGFTEYSNNYYNIKAAMLDDVVYPSLDAMIWELKYPNIDIEGRSR